MSAVSKLPVSVNVGSSSTPRHRTKHLYALCIFFACIFEWEHTRLPINSRSGTYIYHRNKKQNFNFVFFLVLFSSNNALFSKYPCFLIYPKKTDILIVPLSPYSDRRF